jgi:hypothetical protein
MFPLMNCKSSSQSVSHQVYLWEDNPTSYSHVLALETDFAMIHCLLKYYSGSNGEPVSGDFK